MKVYIINGVEIYNDMPRGWICGKGQPKWHSIIYYKWVDMWRRCTSPPGTRNYKYYKDAYPDEVLKYLSVFVNTLSKDPIFEEFSLNPYGFDLDKDSKAINNHHYSIDTICLLRSRDNKLESLKRTNYNPPTPIIGIGKDRIYLFKQLSDSKYFGFSKGGISSHLKGTYPYPPYKGVKWYKINYSHSPLRGDRSVKSYK